MSSSLISPACSHPGAWGKRPVQVRNEQGHHQERRHSGKKNLKESRMTITSETPTFATSLAGLAVIGTVFGFVIRGWSSIRSFLQSCMSVLVVTARLDDETTTTAVLAYLNNSTLTQQWSWLL